MTSSIAHLATAFAYLMIGVILLWISLKVWWTHPLNRAFRLGPYITEDGLRLVLSLWPFVFLFGAFILSCAIDHAAHFALEMGWLNHLWRDFFAVIESVISLWTAGCVVLAAAGLRWTTK